MCLVWLMLVISNGWNGAGLAACQGCQLSEAPAPHDPDLAEASVENGLMDGYKDLWVTSSLAF